MRRILRASGLMGGASAASIVAGIGRAKVLAVLVGAEGVGLFGLFQSFQGVAAALAGLGLPASGVREVALARAADDQESLGAMKRALLRLPLATGLVTVTVCSLARRPIAVWLFDDVRYAGSVVLIGLAIAALTVSLCQTAWLQGLRKVGILARLKALGALAAAILAIALVWRYGLAGVAWAVAASSVALLLMTSWAWRSPAADAWRSRADRRAVRRASGRLLRLGFPLMLAGLLTPATHLAVRSLVLHKLGAPSLGHWQAAWSLSMVYVGFVLAAMAVDYLPRLSAAGGEPEETTRLVDEQVRVALLLASPVILTMLAAAPFVVRLLYSADFDPATSVLTWQLVGDFFKVPAWALVTVFAAGGRGGAHLLAEALWNVPYLALVWLGIDRFGLPFCGVAFLLAYGLYFAGLWLSHRRTIGFRWSAPTLALLAAGLSAAAVVRWLATRGTAGMVAQVVIVLAFALFSFYRIRQELSVAEYG